MWPSWHLQLSTLAERQLESGTVLSWLLSGLILKTFLGQLYIGKCFREISNFPNVLQLVGYRIRIQTQCGLSQKYHFLISVSFFFGRSDMINQATKQFWRPCWSSQRSTKKVPQQIFFLVNTIVELLLRGEQYCRQTAWVLKWKIPGQGTE